jgi:hypothetical protein
VPTQQLCSKKTSIIIIILTLKIIYLWRQQTFLGAIDPFHHTCSIKMISIITKSQSSKLCGKIFLICIKIHHSLCQTQHLYPALNRSNSSSSTLLVHKIKESHKRWTLWLNSHMSAPLTQDVQDLSKKDLAPDHLMVSSIAFLSAFSRTLILTLSSSPAIKAATTSCKSLLIYAKCIISLFTRSLVANC